MLEKETSYLENTLIPHLLIQFASYPNYGLLNGKMGGILFFAQYAKICKKPEYNHYCDLLMEEIGSRLNTETNISFANGLCGIGWGIEYLVQNRLSGGNTDELLKAVDCKIIESDPIRMQDKSLFYGLEGIFCYVMARIKSFERTDKRTPFDMEYLLRLGKAVNQADFINQRFPIPQQVAEFNAILNGTIQYSTKLDLPRRLYENLPDIGNDLQQTPLGIQKGLTGLAFKLLLR